MLVCLTALAGCSDGQSDTERSFRVSDDPLSGVITADSLPEYSGSPYVEIDGNEPNFSKDEITTQSFESYSELDGLGRCGTACACVGVDIMPSEERGSIGMIKPSGWHTVRYDDLVDGKYLYNRCHLIAFQLAGENANERNLITGTRYMNVTGMLPFEEETGDYVRDTGNHVMYRVTPYFEGQDLVAKGVFMEAYSVEDEGEGVSFNIFVYNVQPGVEIDYATGESWRSGSAESGAKPDTGETDDAEAQYIGNKNSRKFHRPSCSNLPADKNRVIFETRQEASDAGYTPCDNCNP